MTPAVEQLVRETVELTGAPLPGLLEEDAPVLSDAALSGDREGFYLVGLIGGKEVGKSALVNALAGRPITSITSHGPGTEIVIAYAHRSVEAALHDLLERAAPRQYRIVPHDLASLRRQVLLDLPDIDSRFDSHLQLTRSMLRHVLYPVWLASVEKYADRQPQQMLARVASGNTPDNFIFCLNKADQLKADTPAGQTALEAIREDYAARVAATLSLPAPPRVFMISALQPAGFDLPELRQLLAEQKATEAVQESKQMAVRRQDQSVVTWLDRQDLPARAAQAERLAREAEEMAAERLATPLLETVIPRLNDDPGALAAMTDEILRQRVARWPLVNLVHTLLAPLLGVARGGAAPGLGSSAENLVGAHLEEVAGVPRGAPAATDNRLRTGGLALLVQSLFAQLRQSDPAVAELYAHNHLWEEMPAELAVADLRRTMAATLDRQRNAARERIAGDRGLVAPLIRLLLTVGALLWFPFLQPILEAWLGSPDANSPARILGLVVKVLGVNYLLTSTAFLLIYFTILWLALRWNTQRRLAALLGRWRTAGRTDPSLSLTHQTIEWLDGLLAPTRRHRDRFQSLADRAAAFRTAAAA